MEFGLQLDEATDSNKDAHFISYVGFLDDNILLFCKSIIVSLKILSSAKTLLKA